jgi:tRNA G46 methylase TrmB
VAGGVIDLATDSDAYVDEIREVFSGVAGMVPVPEARMGVGGVAGDRPTVFEERWRALGRAIHFLRFRKAP